MPALFKVRTPIEALYCLLPFAFLVLWFIAGLRIILERLCFIEILVEDGIFALRYGMLTWCSKLPIGRRHGSRNENIAALLARCASLVTIAVKYEQTIKKAGQISLSGLFCAWQFF